MTDSYIVLSFEDFDTCVDVLEELFDHFVSHSGDSSYSTTLLADCVRTISHTPVCSILLEMLERHGWSGSQFTHAIQTGIITHEINNIMDRMYAS